MWGVGSEEISTLVPAMYAMAEGSIALSRAVVIQRWRVVHAHRVRQACPLGGVFEGFAQVADPPSLDLAQVAGFVL